VTEAVSGRVVVYDQAEWRPAQPVWRCARGPCRHAARQLSSWAVAAVSGQPKDGSPTTRDGCSPTARPRAWYFRAKLPVGGIDAWEIRLAKGGCRSASWYVRCITRCSSYQSK